MLGLDKVTIITKLAMLNRYLEEDKNKIEKNIQFWEERIEECGENANVPRTGFTYKEALNRSILQHEDCIKKIEENNRLIEVLEKGE